MYRINQLASNRLTTTPLKDRLKIKGMTFHAFHGVTEVERESGQRFEVDVELLLDLTMAGRTDLMENTIDVRDIYETVEEVVIEGHFMLIEAMAQRIADVIFDRYSVGEVIVRIAKPYAALGGIARGVEVEINRLREAND
jgi:dihydroneopterin aldolase